MNKLHLVPSIYLSGGNARIVNKNTNEVNFADPVDLAVELEEIGFDELLLIDVDGASSGNFNSFNVLNEIVSITDFEVLTGGGIRDELMVEKTFNAGASRVLLNSIAATDKELMLRLIDVYGNNSIVVGVDVNESGVLIEGRKNSVLESVAELIGFYVEAGIDRYIIQTLNQSGNKIAPNPVFFKQLKDAFYHTRIYAGEGLDNTLQFIDFEHIGLSGLIIGDEFYTNQDLFLGLKKYHQNL